MGGLNWTTLLGIWGEDEELEMGLLGILGLISRGSWGSSLGLGREEKREDLDVGFGGGRELNNDEGLGLGREEERGGFGGG